MDPKPKYPKDEVAARLATARLAATQLAPYFADALITLVPREMPGLGTFAVSNKGFLLYDPVTLMEWPLAGASWVLLHEVMHVVLNHSGRVPGLPQDPALPPVMFEGVEYHYDPKTWNYAGDATINESLVAMGAELPGDPVTPSSMGLPDHGTAEEYYALLMEKKDEGGEGEGGDEGESGQDEGKGSEGGESQGEGQGQSKSGKHGHGECRCGSGAGNPQDNEPGEGDSEARTEVDLERLRRVTAEAIDQHSKSNGIGSVPAGLERWARDYVKPPKIRWQDRLARAIRRAYAKRAGCVDYDYSRPSRRQAGVGFGPGKVILPRMYAPVPKVAFAIDTSGSMGDAEVQTAMTECDGVIRAVRVPVTFLSCDAAVHNMKQVKTASEAAKLIAGGGGTNFCPVFEALDKKNKPDIIIYATDGYGPAPATPPRGVQVIWVLIGNTRPPAPWGEYIAITVD